MESLFDSLLDTFFPKTQKDHILEPASAPDVKPFPTEVPPPTHCCMCGTKIEVMCYKGTRVCSTNCEKAARGETPDGWIETRVGRVGFRIGKKVRFDLVDPFLHVEGTLVKVEDSDRSPVARKIVLEGATGQSAAVRYGRTMRIAEKIIASAFDLPLDHRIDFKP